ncbi:MAG: InlB B-repeat-containing protein, partial [Aedoeadaptatus pacaensis]
MYSVDFKPFKYSVFIDKGIAEKVKLITSLSAPTPSTTFKKENGKFVADIKFKIDLQQVAATNFTSVWKTEVEESGRPQIQGNYVITEDGDEITTPFNFPKNDTDRTVIRDGFVENFVEDEANEIYALIVDELVNTPKSVEVKTDTSDLTFEEKDGITTVKSGDHKFKYDFTYDVIKGGKLIMTEILPVTFDANGGKFASLDENAEQKIKSEVDYDGNLTDKAEEPKKDRETFKGWATAKNGTPLSKEEFEKATKNIKEAKTFYAIWDNNEITAEELEVKESFKDGTGYVNDFIPKLADLKAQVKIKDGSGTPQDLATSDTFAIVDGATEYTTDEQLKTYLYEKLQEKDDGNKPNRIETVKAKVTHKNGTSQTVDIPIKVIKNIYEAKTLTEKPFYVPDDYVKVTLDPTAKAQDSQKTYYYVNPAAKVVIPGKDPVGTGDNQFTKWLIDGTDTVYELAKKPRHQFNSETTIKAQYVSDVIPQDGDTKPESVPDNFVKVTFAPTDKGTMEGDKIFWVNPEKKVTIPVKNPVGKTYYTFKEWKIGDVNTGETYTVGTPKQFTDKNGTTITATYTEAKNIIPYDPSATDPMPRPKGYVRVTFAADPGLKLTEQKAYYVKKNAGITLGNEELAKPGYEEQTGYKFEKWDREDTVEIIETDIVVTAKATQLDNVIPEKDKNGNNNTKPEGYKEVAFVVKTDDESKGKLEGVTKFYVNPMEYVTINPPTTKANTGYKFGAGDKDTTIPTVYDKDTTITGSFNGLKDVIPKTKTDESEKPAGYVTVTFVTELPERGKIADGETTVYYVKPNTPVTIPAPKTEANRGFKFDKWYLMGVKEFPSEDVSYDKDREVVGRFVGLDSFIPSTDEHDNPNEKPSGYVTVIFTDGKYGTITSGKKVYYVNPDANVKMSYLTSSKNKNRPQVKPDTGYKFSGWRFDGNDVIKEDLTVPANYTYEKDVIPKTKDDESEKPEGYINVIFSTEKDGKIKGTTDKKTKVVYVNPKKAVVLKGQEPDVTPNAGFEFTGWDTQIEKAIQYKDNEVIKAKYKTIADVVPQKGEEKPEGVPENFVKITFVPTDKGTMEGAKIFWVNPEVKVTIPVKDPVGATYFKFDKWKLGEKADGADYTPSVETQFKENTTITATYEEAKNIIPYNPEEPITRPDGYVRVTFEAETGLKLTESKAYYVKKNAKDEHGTALTLASLAKPSYEAQTGYKFTEWDKEDSTVIEATDIVVTAKATKLDKVIPEKDKNGNDNEKPEGYKEVIFVIKDDDKTKGKLEGVTKFYVNPTEYVTINPPKTTANTGFEFGTWDKDATIPTVYDKDATITGSFNGLKDVIPKTNPDGTANQKPDGYTT